MTHTQTATLTQSHALLPIPTADTFGASAALFELGGMIVIHDPSGCNSTYTTHDEPRWYDTDSLLFISALTEYDAILGRDDKLIHDIETSAKEFHSAFICILPSQIAHLIATDLPAISRIIERDTHIPTFTLPTNSMHPYDKGIEYALERLAHHLVEISSHKNGETIVPSQPHSSEKPQPTSATPPAASGPVKSPLETSRLWEWGCRNCIASRNQAILRSGGGFQKETFSCKETEKSKPNDVNQQPQNSSSLSGRVSVVSVGSPSQTATTNQPSRPRTSRVNLLGLTPLDYHWQRALPSLRSFLTTHHLAFAASLTLHTTLSAIEQTAPTADVNLVLTASALPAAKILETALHIPYIAAVPYPPIADEIAAALHQAAKDKKSRILYRSDEPEPPSQPHSSEPPQPTSGTPPALRALPPLRGELRNKDSEQSERLRSFKAPYSQADRNQSDRLRPASEPSPLAATPRVSGPSSGRRGLCDSERSGEHPSGAEKTNKAALKNITPESPSSPRNIAREDSPLSESAQSPRPTATTSPSSRPRPTNLLLTEPLASHSLRAALALCGHPFTILPPPASEPSFQTTLSTATTLLSDPLYFHLAPKAVKTIPLPRRAISGRTFEKKERNLLDQAEWAALLQELQP